jgi:hypothetical protein
VLADFTLSNLFSCCNTASVHQCIFRGLYVHCLSKKLAAQFWTLTSSYGQQFMSQVRLEFGFAVVVSIRAVP